jgi:hypothetical protein
MDDFLLLPPSPDVCQTCAVDHPEDLPHNRDSLFYQYRFYIDNKRWPTWTDAMAHCAPSIKEQWTKALLDRGVKID